MNAPFDLKNLINPFAIPPKKTLADVAQQVAAADLPAVRKRDLLSALRRIRGLSGKPLTAIAADVEFLQVLLAELQGKAAHRLKSKTWSNLRSALLSALEMTGSARVLRTHRVPYTSDWGHLINSRPDKKHAVWAHPVRPLLLGKWDLAEASGHHRPQRIRRRFAGGKASSQGR